MEKYHKIRWRSYQSTLRAILTRKLNGTQVNQGPHPYQISNFPLLDSLLKSCILIIDQVSRLSHSSALRHE